MIAPSEQESGYRLHRIYVADQAYRLVPPTDDLRPSTQHGDRSGNVGWDWRPLGQRQFEVILHVTLDPTTATPEAAHVRIVGVFEGVGEIPSVSFREFLTANGPAILFPYAREAISTMTGRGPYGAFHLNPLNVRALGAAFDLDATEGARVLRDNPDIAKGFQLTFSDPTTSST